MNVTPPPARVGKLRVLRYVGANGGKQGLWECACDCGIVKLVSTGELKRGSTKSCGCEQRRRAGVLMRLRVRSHANENGCFVWDGSCRPDGYINFKMPNGTRNGAAVSGHRIAYELMRGPIPGSAQVLHRCDNRRCWNPAHLFLGTHTDNMRDMVSKGRHVRQVASRAMTECFAKGLL